MKRIFAYIWKLPLCGIGFFIVMALNGTVMPIQVSWLRVVPAAMAPVYFLAGVILAFILSLISRKLQTIWLVRWIILAEITWVCGAVGVAVASLFTVISWPVSSAIMALFSLLGFLLPSLVISALASALFQPNPTLPVHLYDSTSLRKPANWLGRTAATLWNLPLRCFAYLLQ